MPFLSTALIILYTLIIRNFSIYEPGMFVDPDGILPLSPKQMKKFKTWRRGADMFHLDPKEACKRPLYLAVNITGYEIMYCLFYFLSTYLILIGRVWLEIAPSSPVWLCQLIGNYYPRDDIFTRRFCILNEIQYVLWVFAQIDVIIDHFSCFP